jgi:hypothetical protein
LVDCCLDGWMAVCLDGWMAGCLTGRMVEYKYVLSHIWSCADGWMVGAGIQIYPPGGAVWCVIELNKSSVL